MSFCWSTIMVKDMKESLEFYRDIVGLEVDKPFAAGKGKEIVFLGKGETKVELICDVSQKEVDIGADISLGFKVDSLEKKAEFIKSRGIKIHSGPFEPNPNTKFFYILDPNGLRIQFVEQR